MTCRTPSLALVLVLVATATLGAQTPDGAALFEERCAQCHTPPGVDRAPTLEALRGRGPDAIVNALTDGLMQVEGADLTGPERLAVAVFIAGTDRGDTTDTTLGACESAPALGDPLAAPYWTGWGAGPRNLRFQPAEHARLTAGQVPDLTLRWAVGFAAPTSMWAQPTVAGGHLFIGGQDGTVSAFDAATGCRHWAYGASAGVRTAISLGARSDDRGHALFFGDVDANVYAIDAATGDELWTREVETHPGARITGAPVLHDGRLYVTVSSLEEALASMDAIVIPPETSNLSGIVKDTRKGTEISRALLILALLIFILQGFLAMIFTKRMTATGDSDLQQSLRKHTVVAARRT